MSWPGDLEMASKSMSGVSYNLGAHLDTVSRDTAFGPIVQLAFHAPDIARAAHWFVSELRAGPFFLMEHIPLSACLIHGETGAFDHSSAYGQCGDIMVELIHQHDDAASPVRDMFGADEEGLHHAAVFVDDIDTAVASAAEQGMALALDATTQDGVRFVMVDARAQYGFMLEFYERVEALERFYAFVKRKSDGWDGAEPLRRL